MDQSVTPERNDITAVGWVISVTQTIDFNRQWTFRLRKLSRWWRISNDLKGAAFKDCMLTWSKSSVNTVLRSLWFLSLVSQFTECNIMFIFYILSHIRDKKYDKAEYTLRRAACSGHTFSFRSDGWRNGGDIFYLQSMPQTHTICM